MERHDRDGPGWRARSAPRLPVVRRHRCDGRDAIRESTRQHVRHAAAHGEAGGEHAGRVDALARRELVDERQSRTRCPYRPEVPRGSLADALRVRHDEPVRIRRVGQAARVLQVPIATAIAVEREHQRARSIAGRRGASTRASRSTPSTSTVTTAPGSMAGAGSQPMEPPRHSGTWRTGPGPGGER